MYFSFPPTLVKLAIQKLMSEEALAISVLQDVPDKRFPVMFQEAITDGKTKILTAMIPLWPFPYLSIGMLIDNLSLDTLKAVLEGIDILISEPVRSSKCKLREIIWGDTDHDLLRIWTGSQEKGLPEFIEEKQPDCGMKKELKVTTRLHILAGSPDECVTYLLKWAQKRKNSIHLCCRKLRIETLINAKVIKIIKTIHADCVQHLDLSCLHLDEIDYFNPYLKQMTNLLTLSLEEINDNSLFKSYARKENEDKTITLISQLPTLHHLQELSITDIPFIKGNLKECFRCLKKPLEILDITECKLTQSDLDYLPYCLNIFELKHLYLFDIPLCHLFLEPLGFILKKVSHSLKVLKLNSCEMGESQFNVVLPVLRLCSQLTEVDFYGIDLSLLLLKKILHHTAKLSQLTRELYPAPLECYENRDVILSDRLEKICPELLDILRAKRQPKKVTFATTPCSKCSRHCVYDLETQCCFFTKEL